MTSYPTSLLPIYAKKFFLKNVREVAWAPFLLFISLTALHNFYPEIISLTGITDPSIEMEQAEPYVYWIGSIACVYWLIIRTINASKQAVLKSNFLIKYYHLSILFPFFCSLMKAVLFLVFANQILQGIYVIPSLSYALNKISSILIIFAITWIVLKLVKMGSELLIHHYTINTKGPVINSKIYTQTVIIKRIIFGLICVLSAGSILMLFENVRALGASVLTTAGIAGLLITFTAQRSLAGIFSGLEIALTQPIKIGDSVVIENKKGVIEEINFRNVIIRLWDQHHLIVPTNYFLEKPFQNETRQLEDHFIGAVFLYVDFTLPLQIIREQLASILKESTFWDGKLGTIEVSDLQQHAMQLKIVLSSKSASDLSSLQNYIREKIIAYIVKYYPQALPNFSLLQERNKGESYNVAGTA